MCFKQPKPQKAAIPATAVSNSDGDADAIVKDTTIGSDGVIGSETGKVQIGAKRKRKGVPGLAI